jgi:hypothetical protein
MPKAPTIQAPPPPPPPPPVLPQKAVRLDQEKKLKRKLSDPRRMGRTQTIQTGPRGVMEEEEGIRTGSSLLKGKRRAKASD